jgi:hypothetical protein
MGSRRPLLVERFEHCGSGLQLTFCQQAQVVDAVAAGICTELGCARAGKRHLAQRISAA